jgi:hypothetical protein
MNPAVRENGWSYWLQLTWNTITYYARHRRWRALVRSGWATGMRGYFGELCQACGRSYVLWWEESAALWREVVGCHAGLLCPACFDSQARERDIYLIWNPTRYPLVPTEEAE